MGLLALSLVGQAQCQYYEKFFEVDGGPEYMYYFSKVQVGSNRADQSVIIDTGSDTLAFPCDSCERNECGTHQDPRFQTSGSSSFKYSINCSNRILFRSSNVCQFVKSYAEGSSLLGFLAEDYLKFKNTHRMNDLRLKKLNAMMQKDFRMKAEFGCTTKETGLFKTQFADGILGLDDGSTFIQSIEDENSSNRHKVFSFGLCFHNTGGIMSIDLRERNRNDAPITVLSRNPGELDHPVAVRYTSDNSYFEVYTERFEVGNMRLDLDGINVMVDSGTTFTHFPTEYIQAIMKALNMFCASSSDRCGRIKGAVFNEESCLQFKQPDDTYKNVKELLDTFPEIKFYFKGSNKPYIIYPKNYFYQEYDEVKDNPEIKLCMALKGEEEGRIILGAFSMIDNYFYFDRKAKMLRIYKEDCFLRAALILKKDRVLEESRGWRQNGVNWLTVGVSVLGVCVLVRSLLGRYNRTRTSIEIKG